ncbi:PsiF family protein [Lichenifustis flavocetrariae]|uniref:PsiF family protein n=1 Tax=Lichenifustis flavocetrariae TaxID=2949735 RepID=A0AA42CQK2_9HYPH|nr:PsiF family protein [Lichenifustis flavocetrariae]MCW6511537.1 PsiF family protein [Lichenifustis flavocetrariae]
MLRFIVIAGAFAASVTCAQADDTCTSRASAKKLAGAALTSFMTKCQKDAGATCDTTATGKKLAGAARTSFTKKCVSDAVGT